jgi:Fe2+ transport system protein FeoA
MSIMRLRLNATRPRTLADLAPGEEGVLEGIELPGPDARRLMELGFVPGMRVRAAGAAPGGDPRVFRVDGSEIALRRETARHLVLKREGDAG